jgi:hypothetical protein
LAKKGIKKWFQKIGKSKELINDEEKKKKVVIDERKESMV